MRDEEQTLRQAMQTSFDQRGLDGVCDAVAAMLNELLTPDSQMSISGDCYQTEPRHATNRCSDHGF